MSNHDSVGPASVQPRVTFLVPCFNYARYLEACIGSIQRQTFQDFEILILDDASSDETPQLAQALARQDARITYHRHAQNLGHLQNYNFGIQRAQGEFIWLISADDALASPEVLAGFVQAFDSDPRLGYAFCRVQCMDEQGRPYPKFIPNPQHTALPEQPTLFPGRQLFGQLIQANFVPAPSTMARRACYQQYGLFHPQLSHSGDWYNWLLFCLDWNVWFEPQAKVYYRKHPQNMHQTYQKPRFALENTLLCYQTLARFLKEKGYPWRLRLRCQQARWQFMRRNGFALQAWERWARWAAKPFLK